MKTIYLISSGTCNDKGDKSDKCKYLLHPDNIEKEIDVISLNNNDAYYLQLVKIKAKKYSEEDLDKLYNQKVEVYDLFSAIREDNISDEGIRKTISEYRKFMIDYGIIPKEESHTFRDVYKLKNTPKEWAVYAVKEIKRTPVTAADVKEVQDYGWCNFLVDFLVKYVLKPLKEKGEDFVEEIHIFLHDKDIEGYSNLSLQMIESREACREKNLINDASLKELKDRNIKLDITFFMHTNPYIEDILDCKEEHFTERIKYLKEKFDVTLDYLRGIEKKRKLANKIKNKKD